MRYDNKEEVERWLNNVEKIPYCFGDKIYSGKKVRSKIERLLEERKPEVFSPDAFYDLATEELTRKYRRSGRLLGDYDDIIGAA